MARKGTEKVRTGCHTCKARKIKCDEARPACLKCTNSGRKCDGYPTRAQGAYSWNELINASAIIPSPSVVRSNREGRALEFFQHVVAPGLSIYPDKQFWTTLVPAAAQDQLAIRHAVVSISSIYEQLGNQRGNLLGSFEGRFALSHYNQALSLLLTAADDSRTTLFLCILFICIEILQDNEPGAAEHCRHGIKILNTVAISPWVRDNLMPVFIRLSILPLFSGKSPATFPSLAHVQPEIAVPFATLDDALVVLDVLAARLMRTIRLADPYKLGDLLHLDFPEDLRRECASLSVETDQWLQHFSDFQLAHPPRSPLEKDPYGNALMKGLIGKVWINSALDKTEMSYDTQLSTFKAIVDIAEDVISSLPPGQSLASKSKFAFGLGYLPLLYLVVLRCRSLDIRYAALKALDKLAVPNEAQFELNTMRTVGKRAIEFEHGISVDAFGRGECPEASLFVPPDEMRLRDVYITKDTTVKCNADGERALCIRITFLVYEPGGIDHVDEWVELGPVPASRTPSPSLG